MKVERGNLSPVRVSTTKDGLYIQCGMGGFGLTTKEAAKLATLLTRDPINPGDQWINVSTDVVFTIDWVNEKEVRYTKEVGYIRNLDEFYRYFKRV